MEALPGGDDSEESVLAECVRSLKLPDAPFAMLTEKSLAPDEHRRLVESISKLRVQCCARGVAAAEGGENAQAPRLDLAQGQLESRGILQCVDSEFRGADGRQARASGTCERGRRERRDADVGGLGLREQQL